VIFRQQVVNAFTAISALLLTILTIKQIRSNRQKRAANIFLEQKVRERTRELEQSNDTLARSLDEQTVLLQKVSSNITSAVATIKGLCSLGLSDSETSYGGQYIRNIEATSDHLLSVVSRALSPKTTK
jgi:C4-dicarboxylate-specific signal transduction histidine kinase